MRARILEEPELEFGNGGRHVDPRTGISDYGPVDDAAPGSAEDHSRRHRRPR